ncbi:hypothetical protein C2845_PM17G04560 [Panicum miliaceum]|uniref:Uncharacterized protein n=1 Tax=Panicum miliaceum TaxID=4540 RepID=A0A3L6Q440_PANMI|nr:hypothetical protein C2845_PM17G04560 [Panicum miliaceum]
MTDCITYEAIKETVKSTTNMSFLRRNTRRVASVGARHTISNRIKKLKARIHDVSERRRRCKQFDDAMHVHLRHLSRRLATGLMWIPRERMRWSMTNVFLTVL